MKSLRAVEFRAPFTRKAASKKRCGEAAGKAKTCWIPAVPAAAWPAPRGLEGGRAELVPSAPMSHQLTPSLAKPWSSPLAVDRISTELPLTTVQGVAGFFPTTCCSKLPSEKIGSGRTETECRRLLVPPGRVASSEVAELPAARNSCSGSRSFEVAPSPKFHAHVTTSPVVRFLNATWSGSYPSRGLAEKSTAGGFELTITAPSCLAAFEPPGPSAVSVTEKVPEAE